MDIEIRVPATVANLGPGFDCLGVAVGTYLTVRVSPAEEFQITGSSKPRAPGSSLMVQAFRRAFDSAGATAPTVAFEVLEEYPSARGMGASASAIIAGLVAARQTGNLEISDEGLARLAVELEGHSDNVLPALFGGLLLTGERGWLRLEPSAELAPLLLVAGGKFKTEEARAVLPQEVPRADAVANAAATASLGLALTGHHPPEALMMATEDRLHEPYRLPLMPETLDLHRAMRAEGVPTALAGAGPSLICIVERDRVAEAADLARKKAPENWEVLTPGWDLEGALVR